jgi:hypothetical protein
MRDGHGGNGGRRYGRRTALSAVALAGMALVLLLGGCTGVGVAGPPAQGRAEYQVWGLNEASSTLSGPDRTVVLNGDLDNDAKPFFTAEGEWGPDGFVLDEESATAARELAGALPERTGDPACTRMVLVDEGLFGDHAIAAIVAADLGEQGRPVVATALDE